MVVTLVAPHTTQSDEDRIAIMTMVKEGKLDLKLAIAAIEKGASPREPLPAQASPLETCLPGPCFERDRRRAWGLREERTLLDSASYDPPYNSPFK